MTDMLCSDIQPQLAAYADGELPPALQGLIEAHLDGCAGCRHEAAVQATMRQALAAHGSELSVAAPPWLRTRIATQIAPEGPAAGGVGWRTRLSAVAAAAIVVLAIGAVALPVVTSRSTVVLAAQLALDHLKCFTIDGHETGKTLTVADAESELRAEYGWSLTVPPTAGAFDARLVAVRRCLYGDGRAAHLLYRLNGSPVSLFILPGLERPSEELALLGQAELVWTAEGRTYMLVGSEELRNQLTQMASNLRNEAK
ncbi:MAG: zf-HC2 domain-containing protein [Acidobacteria bacterium]|nr:zf-HC2 domain-containing protein [Acidobacteriota bacterium]